MKENSNIFRNLLLKIEKAKIEISDEERTKSVQSVINFLLRGYEEYYNIPSDNETRRLQTKELLDDLIRQVDTSIDKNILPIVTISTLNSVRSSFYDASEILAPQNDTQNSKDLAKKTVKDFSDSIISRIDDTLKVRKRENFETYLKNLLSTSYDFNDSNRNNNVSLIVDVLRDYTEDYYSSKPENRQQLENETKNATFKFAEYIELVLKSNNPTLIKKTYNSFENVYKNLSNSVSGKEGNIKEAAISGALIIVEGALERINQFIQEESVKQASNVINKNNTQQPMNDHVLRRPMGVPEVAWRMWPYEQKLAYSKQFDDIFTQDNRQEKNLQETSLTTKKEENKIVETIKNIGRKIKQSFDSFRSKKNKNDNQYQPSSMQNRPQPSSIQNRQQSMSTEQEQWYYRGPAPLEKYDETEWIRQEPPGNPEMPQFTQARPARAHIMPELYPDTQQHFQRRTVQNPDPVINDWHPQEQFRRSLYIPPEELGVDPNSPINSWHKINGKTYIKKEQGMVQVLGKDL